MGTPIRVLSENFPMNTNMTGFSWSSKNSDKYGISTLKMAMALDRKWFILTFNTAREIVVVMVMVGCVD